MHIATVQQARDFLGELGCHAAGIDIMAPKALSVEIRIDGLLPQAANILKQEMLAKGGEVAVPAGTLCMNAGRTSCIASGTLSQFFRLDSLLREQPFELSELASQLDLFCTLTSSGASMNVLGSNIDIGIGGLINCDSIPPGVRDRTANAVALAWNLLEQHCSFLVAEGSDGMMVHDLVRRLEDLAACPVLAWVHGDQSTDLVPSMPVIVEEGCRKQTCAFSDGPVFAICSSSAPLGFLQGIVSCGVSPERLFISCVLQQDHACDTADISAGYLDGLPRLDAVIVHKREIAPLAMTTQACALALFMRRGVRTFISDAPSRINDLIAAARQNPWNC